MALQGRHPVTIWGRNPKALEDVLQRGLADRAETDLAAAVKDASLVVLCTPVDSM